MHLRHRRQQNLRPVWASKGVPMLSRFGSLMIATVGDQNESRSTTASPLRRGLDGRYRAKLSPTAGELYTETVRLPLWPA